ncbi:transglycosylase SLT domain-containing protein [Gracilinema caldarium]|uniref:Lytic transglycosylase catalytic n=1 Tax=Gracilinema caldarium (strain ATCC 51460 / DSM 7334 / H1) TaxID=744872 RepID=F8F3N5_GRAC1|nr:transglycosylase SLT domain-containing protein [Gracilinema caldarium]AEJ19979.1 Lytic transglycosylase catalytic [Gracilinema caldarium DSM 7334]
MRYTTIIVGNILIILNFSIFASEMQPLHQHNPLQSEQYSPATEIVRSNGAAIRIKIDTEYVQNGLSAVSMNKLPLNWHGMQGVELSIPGLNALLTQQYIKQYTSPAGLQWLKAVMNRGKVYLPLIRKEVEEMNLPLELAYLPVIESAFLPTAVSRSGAVGLWQFMKNSIHGYGMVIDEWRDDRRDVLKSTQGALKKLQDNYRYFKDWPLALAAYNAGLGAVQRAVQKAGVKDYWVLCEKKHLKNETIHYVPKFLAIAFILANPSNYGLEPDWTEAPPIERIPVGRMADVKLLEEKAGIEQGILKALNPELYFGITPSDPNYLLKVPAEYKEPIEKLLRNKNENLILFYYHTIHSGDTLSALSRHYGVSVEQIKLSNPGIQDRYLKLGAKIKIPAIKNVGPYERPALPASSIAFEGTHVVKKGETLWSIALAYDVDPEVLATVNGLTLSSILREGYLLKTPIKKIENGGE